MSLSLRVAITCTPLLVWTMLYLISRVATFSPRRFSPFLRTGFVVLMGASVLSVAFDRIHLADVFAIHAFGLIGADFWVTRRYRTDSDSQAKQIVTTIKP